MAKRFIVYVLSAPYRYNLCMHSADRILSGWWRRVGAFLLDGLVLFSAYLVLAGPIIFLMIQDTSDRAVWSFTPGGLAVAAVVLLVTLLYTCLLPVKTNGQTLGKMAFSIRVVKLDGSRIDFLTMFIRYPVMQLGPNMAGNYFPPIYPLAFLYGLLDYLFPLWDKRNQCIHDKVARTVVCYEGPSPKPDAKRISIPSAQGEAPSGGAHPAISKPTGFYPPTMGPDPAWCDDPVSPGMQRLWDGTKWTDTYRGFFEDPDGSGQLRYFDGQRWTDRFI